MSRATVASPRLPKRRAAVPVVFRQLAVVRVEIFAARLGRVLVHWVVGTIPGHPVERIACLTVRPVTSVIAGEVVTLHEI